MKQTLLLLVTLAITSFAAQAEDGEFKYSNTDFKALYNQHRFAQPQQTPWAGTYWPYGEDGLAWRYRAGENSPAEKYDLFARQGKKATLWEKREHACSTLPKEEQEGCRGWWGHCNAWSAAAIKEAEPRESRKVGDVQWNVGDQKALLTELWMESGSLFAGDTNKSVKTGNWVTDANSPDARSLTQSGQSNFEAFWDVVPRHFFMIFTNYVGILRTGVVIDRFTGDEVWNQPVVGYRFLPIRAQDIQKPVVGGNGRSVYPVSLRVKIFWGNDQDVEPDDVSSVFDIKKISDEERVESFGRAGASYEGRLLKFDLHFDAPVVMTSPTEVQSAGRLVGSGIWEHQKNPAAYARKFDETHPDFIWLPTSLYASHGSSNPYIQAKTVYDIVKGTATPTTPPTRPTEPRGGTDEEQGPVYTFEFVLAKLRVGAQADPVKERLKHALKRSGIQTSIVKSEITFTEGKASVRVRVLDGSPQAKLANAFREAGFI
ncbi:MAG: hypothetical protein AB7P04_05210 [Bacteriovoracia bacterium]